MRRKTLGLILVLLLVLVVATGMVGLAAKGGKKPKPSPCQNWDLICPDVWDPVVCDDGKTYSNQCYADRVCATGCEPAGGGPVPF